ncbi:osmoprotectant NAGGN system M42 family peptidase [Rhodopseudomonas sp. BAL398]|nr:osmoprotectant NAGGN system M42 family peptidase [Rhodopseudomonas sp. BAL398]MDF3813311.1 osmoprotectant NAGGN system M42 family peptidase [Rhodopseudomonas sp. BAL398]WOK17224.1 osmoprotectant NAGGN system M42 family peptidase [Rhodopseudomonas sp. BAL398]
MTAKATKKIEIDETYLLDFLKRLLRTPSPSGMTDVIVAIVCAELESLEIPFELTRRGAIRATLKGKTSLPSRALVGHLDTLGATVKHIRDNGRLELVPIGHWSARFAEGARVTVFTDTKQFRGTILPLKASGHTYNEEVDDQPSAWTNVEVRIDAKTSNVAETRALGIQIGDTVSVDAQPEFVNTGFIASRHLDDKAGVAAMLTAVRALHKAKVILPIDCHLLFTLSEEVGVGASAVLHGDVSELVAVDNGTIAPNQNTSTYGVTIAMQDSSGPFDWHLTRSLLKLAQDNDIEHSRDVFRYYRSDGAAAVEAGNDIRAALVCFGLDASHGWERTHKDSLIALTRLLVLYMQSEPLFRRDQQALGPVGDLPPAEIEPLT